MASGERAELATDEYVALSPVRTFVCAVCGCAHVHVVGCGGVHVWGCARVHVSMWPSARCVHLCVHVSMCVCMCVYACV